MDMPAGGGLNLFAISALFSSSQMLKPALRSPSSFAGALRAQRTGSKFRIYAVKGVATIPQRPYKFVRDAAQPMFAPFRLKRFTQTMQDVQRVKCTTPLI